MCHNAISPVNTVFVDGRPTALFDFDMAAPGPRIRDVSYGIFLWLNLGTDGPPPDEQRRRIHVWCDAYGLADRSTRIEEVKQRIRRPSVAVSAMALRTPPAGGSTSSNGWSGTSVPLLDEGPRHVDDPSLGSSPGCGLRSCSLTPVARARRDVSC